MSLKVNPSCNQIQTQMPLTCKRKENPATKPSSFENSTAADEPLKRKENPATKPSSFENSTTADEPLKKKRKSVDKLDGEPPYLKTTEIGQEEALSKLSKIPEKENGIHLGFSFEFNYNLLAQRKVTKAYICDINPRMLTLYTWIQTNIIKTEKRKVFLDNLENELSEKHEYFLRFPPTAREAITHLTSKKFSWLYSDQGYDSIRTYYLEKRIIHMNLNLAGNKEPFEAIALAAKKAGNSFDTIYLSNIPEWLYRSGGLETMKKNLQMVMEPGTILIDAKQKYWESGAPELRINLLKDGVPKFRPNPRKKRAARAQSSTNFPHLSRRAPTHFSRNPTTRFSFMPLPRRRPHTPLTQREITFFQSLSARSPAVPLIPPSPLGFIDEEKGTE